MTSPAGAAATLLPRAGPNTRFLTAADRATRIARKTAMLSDTVGQDITGKPGTKYTPPAGTPADGGSKRCAKPAMRL